MQRNLLYHIYPRSGNGIWQRNVDLMRRRIDQFDGKRVVAVMASPDADPPELVQEAFGLDKRISWLILPNIPHLREVASFLPLFGSIASPDDGITFYGHAKGVTHSITNEAVRIWTEALYSTCLDDPAAVDYDLSHFSTTGAMRKSYSLLNSNWHYHGSFFWFRNDHVFSSNWSKIANHSHGIEAWIGGIIAKDRSGCLFLDDAGVGYDATYSLNTILPELQRWQASRGLPTTPRESDDPFAKPSAWIGLESRYLALCEISDKSSIQRVVDVGVDYGFSTFQFATDFPVADVVGVSDFELHSDSEIWVRRHLYRFPNLRIVVGNSPTVAETFEMPIDLLHIDADHSYESVKADFESWVKWVRPGGRVIFHDTETFSTVRKFFDELPGRKREVSGFNGLGCWFKDG